MEPGTVTYSITGRGANGGTVGRMLIFSVTVFVDGKNILEAKKEELVIHVEGPEKELRVNIMGGSRGLYHIGFTPQEAGQYWADFVFRGRWAAQPYLLPISNFSNTVPQFPYKGIHRTISRDPVLAEKQKMEQEEKKKRDEEEAEKRRIQEEAEKKRIQEVGRFRVSSTPIVPVMLPKPTPAVSGGLPLEEVEKKHLTETQNQPTLSLPNFPLPTSVTTILSVSPRNSVPVPDNNHHPPPARDPPIEKKPEVVVRPMVEDPRRRTVSAAASSNVTHMVRLEPITMVQPQQAVAVSEEEKRKREEAEKKLERYRMEEERRKREDAEKRKKEEMDKKKKDEEEKRRKEEEEKKRKIEEPIFVPQRRDSNPVRWSANLKRTDSSGSRPVELPLPNDISIPKLQRQTEEITEERALRNIQRVKKEREDAEKEERRREEERLREEEERHREERLREEAIKTLEREQVNELERKKLEEVKAREYLLSREASRQARAEKKAREERAVEEERNRKAREAVAAATRAEEFRQSRKIQKTGNVTENLSESDSDSSENGDVLQLTDAEKILEERKKRILEKNYAMEKLALGPVENGSDAVEAKNPVSSSTRSNSTMSAVVAAWEQKAKQQEGDNPKLASGTRGTYVQKYLQSTQISDKKDEENKKANKKNNDKATLGKLWESQLAASSSSRPISAAQKDLEELKAQMEKERAKILLGESTPEPSAFGNGRNILFHFMKTALNSEDLYYLGPINGELPEIFEKLADGIVICKFFDKTIPGKLNPAKIRDKHHATENWNLYLASSRVAGCEPPGVEVQALSRGDNYQIQQVLWAIIKKGLELEVKSCTSYLQKFFNYELFRHDFSTWDFDTILVGWAGEICRNRGVEREVTSIANDFKDSFLYLILLDEALGTGTSMMSVSDDIRKAEEVVLTSELLYRGPVITLEGILKGIYWQNCILLASIFITASTLNF